MHERLLAPSVLLMLLAVDGTATTTQSVAQAPYAESSQRGNARIFYWGGNHSVGQLMIDYGQPAWKEQYEDQIEKSRGLRWRLGQNFWTNLDSNIDLTLAGVKVPAGFYYLAVERKSDGSFALIALDPVKQRERKLDAFEAQKTTGGIEVPMTHEEVEPAAAKLTIALTLDPADKHEATLTIKFGPHALSARVVMHAPAQ